MLKHNVQSRHLVNEMVFYPILLMYHTELGHCRAVALKLGLTCTQQDLRIKHGVIPR